MTKRWRPHIELARLSAALGEEVLAASNAEVHRAHPDGYSIATTAQEVRELIATTSGEADEPNPNLVKSDGQRRIFLAL
jgi:hypothetical protein